MSRMCGSPSVVSAPENAYCLPRFPTSKFIHVEFPSPSRPFISRASDRKAYSSREMGCGESKHDAVATGATVPYRKKLASAVSKKFKAPNAATDPSEQLDKPAEDVANSEANKDVAEPRNDVVAGNAEKDEEPLGINSSPEDEFFSARKETDTVAGVVADANEQQNDVVHGSTQEADVVQPEEHKDVIVNDAVQEGEPENDVVPEPEQQTNAIAEEECNSAATAVVEEQVNDVAAEEGAAVGEQQNDVVPEEQQTDAVPQNDVVPGEEQQIPVVADEENENEVVSEELKETEAAVDDQQQNDVVVPEEEPKSDVVVGDQAENGDVEEKVPSLAAEETGAEAEQSAVDTEEKEAILATEAENPVADEPTADEATIENQHPDAPPAQETS